MRLSFEQIKEVFGRPAVVPGDTLTVNGADWEVESVDAQGAVFVEVEDADEDEAE